MEVITIHRRDSSISFSSCFLWNFNLRIHSSQVIKSLSSQIWRFHFFHPWVYSFSANGLWGGLLYFLWSKALDSPLWLLMRLNSFRFLSLYAKLNANGVLMTIEWLLTFVMRIMKNKTHHEKYCALYAWNHDFLLKDTSRNWHFFHTTWLLNTVMASKTSCRFDLHDVDSLSLRF